MGLSASESPGMEKRLAVHAAPKTCLRVLAFLALGGPALASELPSDPAAAESAAQVAESRSRESSVVPASRLKVLAWQEALEAAGFSPGLLDGLPGPKTSFATRLYQMAMGIRATGELCPETARSLGVDPDSALTAYTISRDDEALVEYCPPDWIERSRRSALLYASLADLVAERFHTTERCLADLNPELDLAALAPGITLRVPRIRERAAPPADFELEIDLGRKAIAIVDGSGNVRGLLHCSVPRDLAAVRRGPTSVVVVAENPTYTFDPKMWPEVPDVRRKLLIPPGPRSPVGIRWIGLDRPGVGIHGSPEPQNIGKTFSHGCFRLTNWDAAYLARYVAVGTKVVVADSAPSLDRALRR